jgi:hypothetical protein
MSQRFGLSTRVSLSDLRNYLIDNGWVALAESSGRWEIFRLANSLVRGIELVLPGSSLLIDAEARIDSAISALSQIEDRPIEALVGQISKSNTDSLLIKLRVQSAKLNSIPLDDASRHVKAMRDLLLYGACSELERKAHFEQPLPAARGMLTGFEFCHTFSGSFGFEVSSEVQPQNLSLDFFTAPARRRIVERLARGLKSLESAVEADSPEVLFQTFDSGLNARMCDALVALAGEDQFPYQVDFIWATSVDPAEDVRGMREIEIEDAEISILKFAAEELKRVEPHTQLLRGLVVNLHCARDPSDGSARRTVEVKSIHPERGMLVVRMALGPSFYAIAIEAHANGLEIEATGQLQRKGNTWTLDAISSFSAIGV